MSLTDIPNDTPKAARSPLRAALPYTTVALILAALYVAWIFYSRAESNRQAEEAIAAKKEEARKRVAGLIYGSGEIKFSTFSVDSGHLQRGETTQLCYGVVNATAVKLSPPVAEIRPSYRHCLEIAPKTTTTYTITAQDAKGHSQSQSLTVRVQ